MGKIGMKRDQIIFKSSKIIIYVWLAFSTFISIIGNKGLNFEHLITSIIFYSIFFMPIYFALISIPLNTKYKRRIIISLISLIPIIISYLCLFLSLKFLIFSIPKSLFFLFIILLLNFSLTIKDKPYFLIFLTFLNTLSSLVIYYFYLISYVNEKIYTLIGIYNQDKYLLDSTIIMIILTSIMLVYVYQLRLIYQIKDGD